MHLEAPGPYSLRPSLQVCDARGGERDPRGLGSVDFGVGGCGTVCELVGDGLQHPRSDVGRRGMVNCAVEKGLKQLRGAGEGRC